MPASARMNDLATRKRMLVAEADLHRQILGLERLRLQGRWHHARGALDENRWWLLGGAVVAGLLLARRWRTFAASLPTVLAIWRGLNR